MRIYTSLEFLPWDMNSVVSIGNFDGVHIGHQELIRAVVQRGEQLRATATIVTFDPHPSLLLSPNTPPKVLTPLPVKLRLFEQFNVQACIVLPFTHELASMSSHDFVERILVGKLHIKEIHEGSNFRFGESADADVCQLTEFGRAFGFGVRIHILTKFDGECVSSSRIRKVLSEGNVEAAAAMLSRPHRHSMAADNRKQGASVSTMEHLSAIG